MKPKMQAVPRRQRGMSLIEVLVSVLVLGVGLMGVAAMQALALRGGQGSLETSQAVMLSTGIIEAMRANRANAANYVYDGTGSCGTIPAAGATLASDDINAWVTAMKQTIGTAADTTTCGRIAAVAGTPGLYRVTIQWDDSRAGGGAARQVVTEAQL